MSFVTLGEPTESEKQVMQAKCRISDSFDYSHKFQMTKTRDLWEYREFGMSLTPKAGDNHYHLEQVKIHFEKWIPRTNNYLMCTNSANVLATWQYFFCRHIRFSKVLSYQK